MTLLGPRLVFGTRPGVRYFLASTFLQVTHLELEQNTEHRYKDPQVKEMNDTSLTKRILTHTAQIKVAVTSGSNHPRLLQRAD